MKQFPQWQPFRADLKRPTIPSPPDHSIQFRRELQKPRETVRTFNPVRPLGIQILHFGGYVCRSQAPR